MNKPTLQSLILLWDSQGLFQGDLNRVQQFCKSWILVQEGEQKVDLLKIQTLAANPDVYKALFERPGVSEEEWQSLEDVPEEEMAYIAEELERFAEFQSQREEL